MNDIQKAGLSANQHIISHTYEYVVFFKYEKNNNKKMFRFHLTTIVCMQWVICNTNVA